MEKYLSEREIEGLLSIIDNVLDKCLITLGIDSGGRVSEVIGILTSNIDYERQTIKIWDVPDRTKAAKKKDNSY